MQTAIPPRTIIGDIVMDWTEDGHRFQIERLPQPIRIGAGDRHFRLWEDGHPASGGQWHYSLSSAVNRAEYVLLGGYHHRINWLELKVSTLERDLADARRGALSEVVKWVERRRDDYVNEHGSYDPETGATEFSDAGEEYVGELDEIVEGLNALKGGV